MRVPLSSPMARFQARLDHLFRTVRAPDGGEYTYRQVAAGIAGLVGYKTSSSYLQELRAGLRINPSMKHLHGLCAFFGVPIAYFFDAGPGRACRCPTRAGRLAARPGSASWLSTRQASRLTPSMRSLRSSNTPDA